MAVREAAGRVSCMLVVIVHQKVCACVLKKTSCVVQTVNLLRRIPSLYLFAHRNELVPQLGSVDPVHFVHSAGHNLHLNSSLSTIGKLKFFLSI